MTQTGRRNVEMAERIARTPVRYPFSFVFAGDSGAWPDRTADAVFAQLVSPAGALDPAPVFFANLGDFAGPGTEARHRDYVRAVIEPLAIPDVCVIGNHDLDDPAPPPPHGRAVHGPTNYDFSPWARTRFVVIDGAHGAGRRARREDSAGRTEGARAAALAYLDEAPGGGHREPHPRRVALTLPPHPGRALRASPPE